MISIRPAGAGDAQKIGVVFDAAVRERWTYLGDLAKESMFPPNEWDKLVADHAPPNVLLVAIDELDDVVGFTAVHPREGEMFLLFVQPEHAGRGVGRALLEAAHSALRAAGCREAFLYTHEENARALTIYEAAGYARTLEKGISSLGKREPSVRASVEPTTQGSRQPVDSPRIWTEMSASVIRGAITSSHRKTLRGGISGIIGPWLDPLRAES